MDDTARIAARERARVIDDANDLDLERIALVYGGWCGLALAESVRDIQREIDRSLSADRYLYDDVEVDVGIEDMELIPLHVESGRESRRKWRARLTQVHAEESGAKAPRVGTYRVVLS